jgi:hypothetical protein
VGPRDGLDIMVKGKVSCLIEPRFFGHLDRIAIPTELQRIIDVIELHFFKVIKPGKI